MANAIGGAARLQRAMQGRAVELERWVQITVFGKPMRPFAPAIAGPLAVLGDIVVNDYTFDAGEPYAVYTIIHEFGHVWDARMGRRLSNRLGWHIGTLQAVRDEESGEYLRFLPWNPYAEKEPPPGEIWGPDDGAKDPNYAHTSGIEDWAEAFATTIYPAYYEDQDDKHYRGIGPLRKAFVLEQIAAIR